MRLTNADYIDICISNTLHEKAILEKELSWLEYKLEKLHEMKKEEEFKLKHKFFVGFTDGEDECTDDVPM